MIEQQAARILLRSGDVADRYVRGIAGKQMELRVMLRHRTEDNGSQEKGTNERDGAVDL